MTNNIKCLVFDCDGVLLDSVPVKTRAFARLAEPYGAEARDRFVMYHMRHGGVSRYRKFAWFFDEIIGRPISEAESKAWGEKFAEYALEEVRACAMIPGAMETLRQWRGKLPMYVCSGAPRTELELILRERGLSEYFNGVFGSPPAKDQLLRDIVALHKDWLPEQFVMVGDASTDRDAAEKAETLFYGIGPELKGGSFPWSENLLPFNAWLSEHDAA